MNLLDEIKLLYINDLTGHDYNHTIRVMNLALKFAEEDLECNQEIVKLTALLHDVDDYKLVGIENSIKMTNAYKFLNKYVSDEFITESVINNIRNIGYHNALNGIRPLSIEGKYVSDADMCDSLGSHGIIRSCQYNYSKGTPFFNPDIFPIIDIDAVSYIEKKGDSCINHFFEKLLKIDQMMLTNAGVIEAKKRKIIIIDFLKNYFEEENSIVWLEFLNEYLKMYK